MLLVVRDVLSAHADLAAMLAVQPVVRLVSRIGRFELVANPIRRLGARLRRGRTRDSVTLTYGGRSLRCRQAPAFENGSHLGWQLHGIMPALGGSHRDKVLKIDPRSGFQSVFRLNLFEPDSHLVQGAK